MERKITKEIHIGDRVIGGGNPILIQSMTNTKTEDVDATVAQIRQLTQAGCDIIRCAVPTMEAACALEEIKKQVEDTRTEVPQRWRDYLSLHITVGARQEVPSETLQYLINQDGRTSRYGQPVYVMQVREKDMGGKFRAWLLNHATFEEIQDGRRKFVECTWVKGYTPDNIRVLLTGWYEVRNAGLCPVDSLEWTEDTEF